jgi:hypothetical protein
MTSKSAANHKIARKPLCRQAHTMPAYLSGNDQEKAMRDIVMTVSFATRATDERVTYLRIYADAEGETHMEEVDLALLPRTFFNGHPPLRLTDTLAATGCNICRVPAGMGVVDWHNPPRRELVIWLTGEVEFETSDGDIRRLAAGSIVLAEDRTGKGHISRHPGEGQLVVHIDLC